MDVRIYTLLFQVQCSILKAKKAILSGESISYFADSLEGVTKMMFETWDYCHRQSLPDKSEGSYSSIRFSRYPYECRVQRMYGDISICLSVMRASMVAIFH